jgi:hypothetical protein
VLLLNAVILQTEGRAVPLQRVWAEHQPGDQSERKAEQHQQRDQQWRLAPMRASLAVAPTRTANAKSRKPKKMMPREIDAGSEWVVITVSGSIYT